MNDKNLHLERLFQELALLDQKRFELAAQITAKMVQELSGKTIPPRDDRQKHAVEMKVR